MTNLSVWEEFCKNVCTFGECDGFVRVRYEEGKCNTCELPTGWQYQPPNVYIIIEQDGSITKMDDYLDQLEKEEDAHHKLFKKTKKKDLKKFFETVIEPQYLGDRNDCHWAVDCKATYVSADTKLPVRNFFWTIVVSKDLEAAKSKTMEIWNEEAERPDGLKYGNDFGDPPVDDRKVDDEQYVIELMREDKSFNPLVRHLDCDWNKDAKSKFSKKQWYTIAELLWDMEDDYKDLKKRIKKEIGDPSFKAFYDAMKELEDERAESRKGIVSIPFKDVWKHINKIRRVRDDFYKKLEKK
jgi:hypothetical protein